ncbi:MAG TPA: hypothetical protein PKE29_13425 [Phycisphaerales bacterium]|nr:hypothetical protein [Phycisphaerales bacterium]
MSTASFTLSSSLIDITTGRIGRVPGATTYGEAVKAYQAAGLKIGDAQCEAQRHHRDLWLIERQRLADEYMNVTLPKQRERRRRAESAG